MLIALLQLYWLSFGLIGLALVLVLRRLAVVRNSKFIYYILHTHPAPQAVLFWVIGLLAFLPVVVPGYVFQWPLWALNAEYMLLLAGSTAVLIVYRKLLIRNIHRPRYSQVGLVLGMVLAAALTYDYIVSLLVGAPLYGDAPVQLAKITFFTHVHLSLADPFYSNHGVVDPRYSTNLLDALQAVAASLLHITAAQIWKYSYGVYRLAIWLSMFGLLWTYLGKKYRHLAYPATALLMVIGSGYFLFAELPDRAVLIWIVLLLLGLKLWLEAGSWPLLIAASLLIAATHMLYAAMTLGYLALILLALGLSNTLPLKRTAPLIVCIGILALPVALNLGYPSHANGSSALFHAGVINGAELQLHHYGPFTLARLSPVSWVSTLLAALFTGYLWLARKMRRTSLTLAAYGAMVVGFVFLLKPGVLALAGYGALLYQTRQRALRIALAALFCYYGLIVYNPLFWRFAAGRAPLWMVARFQELNVFGPAAATLGLLFLMEWPLVQWGYRRTGYVMIAVAAALLLWYFPRPQVNDYRITSLQDAGNIRYNLQRQQRLAALTALRPVLQNQVVYSDDKNLSINLAAVMPINVQSYNPENESPMANLPRRAACAKQLARALRLNDLRAAGVTRIVTDLPYSRKVAAMAKTRPYLSRIAQAEDYTVYAVTPYPSAVLATGVCAIPFGQ